MMSESSFSLRARLRSFVHAGRGVQAMLASQHNAWIHLAATGLVMLSATALHVSRLEWCVLLLAIVSVWMAEALNTAFEFLCDVASPEFHPLVAKAKDVAAGAVLLSAIGAALVGALLFAPHLIDAGSAQARTAGQADTTTALEVRRQELVGKLP